jgi:hypothetical protein
MAENAEDIISEVLTRLGLDTTSPTFITRANVLQQINNCIKDLAENTRVFTKQDTTTLELATDTRSYSLPTDCYDIQRIYNTVDDREVYPVTTDMLDLYDDGWQEDGGTVYYFFRGFEGMDKVSFYKIPDSDYDGEAFQLWYYYYPAALTDSSTSYLPSPIHTSRMMAVDYCMDKFLRMQHEFQDIQEANNSRDRFLVQRRKWGVMDRASNRTYVYGSRKPRIPGPLGPSWPDAYPATRF